MTENISKNCLLCQSFYLFDLNSKADAACDTDAVTRLPNKMAAPGGIVWTTETRFSPQKILKSWKTRCD